MVSRAGVAFVPDDRERQGADVFTFRPGEFLHELGDDVLTIKSNDRTYRFKAAESGTAPRSSRSSMRPWRGLGDAP